jgi:hypothetical protein
MPPMLDDNLSPEPVKAVNRLSYLFLCSDSDLLDIITDEEFLDKVELSVVSSLWC